MLVQLNYKVSVQRMSLLQAGNSLRLWIQMNRQNWRITAGDILTAAHTHTHTRDWTTLVATLWAVWPMLSAESWTWAGVNLFVDTTWINISATHTDLSPCERNCIVFRSLHTTPEATRATADMFLLSVIQPLDWTCVSKCKDEFIYQVTKKGAVLLCEFKLDSAVRNKIILTKQVSCII